MGEETDLVLRLGPYVYVIDRVVQYCLEALDIVCHRAGGTNIMNIKKYGWLLNNFVLRTTELINCSSSMERYRCGKQTATKCIIIILL